MKTHTKVLVFTIIYSLIFISYSCNKDDCIEPMDSTSDPLLEHIDSSIVMDTIWHIDFEKQKRFFLNNGNYFYTERTENDNKTFSFYSIATGKLINELNEDDIPGFFVHNIIMVGDFFVAIIKNLNEKNFIYKFNIPTGDTSVSEVEKWADDRLFLPTFYIENNYTHVLKKTYDLSVVDTLFLFPNKEISTMRLAHINSSIDQIEYLAVAYNERRNDKLNFLLINLNTNEIEEELIFSTDGAFYSLKVVGDMINIICSNLKFSYDLYARDYFAITDYADELDNLYSISTRYPEWPRVFFNDDNNFNAYRLRGGDLNWSRKKFNVDDAYPLNILDDQGENIPYLSFTKSYSFGLLDPYTGEVKFIKDIQLPQKNKVFFEYNILKVYDNSEVLISHWYGISRIKLSKS